MKASGPPMGIEWGSHALRGVAAREAGFISKCCDQARRPSYRIPGRLRAAPRFFGISTPGREIRPFPKTCKYPLLLPGAYVRPARLTERRRSTTGGRSGARCAASAVGPRRAKRAGLAG